MGYLGALSLGWHKAFFVSTRWPKFARWFIPRSKIGVQACYCKITVPLRHVVSVGLIRAMCGLFGATEYRVAKSLVCELIRGPKYLR